MKLKEMLKENGVLATYDNMGFGAENVIKDLCEKCDEQYAKYEWIDGGRIVNAIPPVDMLEAGYPWEEWYKDGEGNLNHHILFLKKTDKCDMTFDCPTSDTTHPAATRGHFWYLYNDEDCRLLYARK